MFRIITLKHRKFSQSDPVLIHQFKKKTAVRSSPVLPKLAPVLIRAHLCCLLLASPETMTTIIHAWEWVVTDVMAN